MAPPRKVASCSMTVLDAMQLRFTSEEQVLGAVCTALLLCERFNVPAQDAFTAASNLMNERVHGEAGMRPEFKAVQLYAANEL